MMTFEIDLQTDVLPVDRRKYRYQPCIHGEIVRINVCFQPSDPECSQCSAHGPEIAGFPEAFILLFFHRLFFSLSLFLLKGIKLKWYEKDPAFNLEQALKWNHHGPEYSRQGQQITVPVRIGIKDHRYKQKPD